MRARVVWTAGVLASTCLTVGGSALAADVPADPSDYRQQFDTLQPGDRLVLAPGDYTSGLRITDVNGQPGLEIIVEGPASGAPARFVGRSGANTIDITDSSYITIRNVVFDGQDIAGIDAIKGSGGVTNWAHHITVENCTITGHDGAETSQQTVGVSTKIPAWDWVVRGNLIDGAGTGMYFGNSDGTCAFVGGLIEGNLFRSTLGYNMQIKHQLARESVPGMPTETRVSVIRHNVFIKENNPSPSGARPNLLVDGPPDSGPGSDDHVEIYGNLFFHNDDDALFQGNGRLHIHDNVFVDSLQPAIRLANHQNKTVIDGLVYNNTIYATATGISFSNQPSGLSLVTGNAIFSDNPLSGTPPGDNVTDSVANAGSYVVNPSIVLGAMDFFPIAGSPLQGSALDLSSVSSDVDYDLDFNGTPKSFTYRGAYEGEGTNPGWQLADDFKVGGGVGGIGGAGGSGGAAGAGGTGAAGGTTGTGGTAAAAGSGGATGGGGSAGATGVGGSAGTSTGGTGAAAGASAGGTSSGGDGAGATGGASSGGSSQMGGSAGAAQPAAGSSATGDDSADDEGGCGCRLPRSRGSAGALAVLAVVGLIAARARRRRGCTR